MGRLRIVLNGDEDDSYEGGAGDGPRMTGEIETIGCLPQGMQSGRTSVFLVAKLEGGGERVFLETSLRHLQMAMAAFNSRYGDETAPEGPDDEIVILGDPGTEH